MPTDRFFHAAALKQNQPIKLDGSEFHHLKHVTRTRCGEAVEIINGEGQCATATLEKLEKSYALLQIIDINQQPKPKSSIILAQAIPRIHRLDFIIEKGTELGVTHFWLFPGQQSERKQFSEHQVYRLQAITIAAMKQCGRLYLPTITLKPPLLTWDAPQHTSFFGDIAPKAPPFFYAWRQHPPKEAVLFFIGPESGFSEEEEVALRRFGATGVKLHQNILRTDTAALAALTLVSQLMMSQNEKATFDGI